MIRRNAWQRGIIALLIIASTALRAEHVSTRSPFHPHPEKPWTLLVYIAGNNNLSRFATLNMKQMVAVGSNEQVNVLVQLDQHGHQKTTRYFIEKGMAKVVGDFHTTQHNASGTKQGLYDSLEWAIKTYPSQHFALVLWNHGSGALEPSIWGRRLIDTTDEMYSYNAQLRKLQLNRDSYDKGIAFNDAFKVYLTNQELKYTLERVCHRLLHKKIDVVAMDACHMASLEVALEIHGSADYLVGSEEVEPGPGWNYTRVLHAFKDQAPTPRQLCKEMVTAYSDQYQSLLCDYTQSAIDLSCAEQLQEGINTISSLLLKLIDADEQSILASQLKSLRTNFQLTTSFYRNNYIDLGHFLVSLRDHLPTFSIAPDKSSIVDLLKTEIERTLLIISQAVYSNKVGSAFLDHDQTPPLAPKIHGVSIYFPLNIIHKSYLKTTLAQSTAWVDFIAAYLKNTGRVDAFGENTNEFDLIPGHELQSLRSKLDMIT